ncbi:hypothetical protein AX14_014399 [Amanita brunnescens Koide BX004]|nr:hypothetical protein AX14_014399 [Amanita brunnescens Koide BX004]
MDPSTGPPPGLPRPKTSPPPPSHSASHFSPDLTMASPVPHRPTTASWASSLAAGLFPATFPVFPVPPQVPHGLLPSDIVPHELLPSNAAVQTAVALHNNSQITDLGTGLPTPSSSDPWHCTHAFVPCAACSVSLFCCTCRALHFTPGPPPASPSAPADVPRSFSTLPRIFRTDIGNGSPPPGFNSHNDEHDDNAYAQALADADTCDNSSCPRGTDEPATYSITVEQFDKGSEETYERIFRACTACNCSCRRSFMGHRIKTRVFDNSTRKAVIANRNSGDDAVTRHRTPAAVDICPARTLDSASCTSAPARAQPDLSTLATDHRAGPIPGSLLYACEHPTDNAVSTTPALSAHSGPLSAVNKLQDALCALNARPPTPVTFVATVRVRHDATCSHSVTSCPSYSSGLLCCSCRQLFAPAVARRLTCANCKHIASVCCTSAFCCTCSKVWLPTDTITPVRAPARHFYGGAGSETALNSSPEPDIWTPSPRSSPDEIDDLTARAALPLPASRPQSDASRAPSRASSVDEPVNVATTPLPTPDYSSLKDNAVDGLIHPSFPDRAILDAMDKRHFLGCGDLSVTSLKLYARHIFSETSHWITAGHFLVDIFQGSTLNGSRDDFRRFVILIGTQLGFGDLALSMSESLDVNRKMADEYMRLHDVATTWKQKAKANSKDAWNG